MRVEMRFRKLAWWQAVQRDLPQARFGARKKEAHAAMRAALAKEGWLADPAARLPAKSPAEGEEAGPYDIDPTSQAEALVDMNMR
jgi:hypothetical protein